MSVLYNKIAICLKTAVLSCFSPVSIDDRVAIYILQNVIVILQKCGPLDTREDDGEKPSF